MISIRKQRQVKLIVILSSVFSVLLLLTLIFGFYPFGLHKKSMGNVPLPKDSLLYISMKSVNSSVAKITDSIYTYRMSHDEATIDYSLKLKSINTFLNNMSNSENVYLKYFTKYICKRNAGILLWELDKNNINNSEIYFISDLGKLHSILLNAFLKDGDFDLNDDTYHIGKSNYRNAKINYLNKNGKRFAVFTSFNGLLIFSKDYDHLKKIIDFINSKSSNLSEISILNSSNENYKPDMSLYINKKMYDTLKDKNNYFFDTLKNFDKASSIYAYTKIYKDKALVDLHINYEYGGSDRSILYANTEVKNIQRYLSATNTAIYFGFDSEIAGLYPLLFNDIKNMSVSNSVYSKLYTELSSFNQYYSLNNIIKELKGEAGFVYLKQTNDSLEYPALAFEVENDTYIIPLFEEVLINKYGDIKKSEKSYRDHFIYMYSLGNNKNIHYTYKDNVMFVSEYEKAINILIDGFYEKESLSWYLSKEAKNMKNTDYIFNANFAMSENIIKSLNLPFKSWTYPEEIIVGTTVGTNSTHVEAIIYVNLENKLD